MSKTKKHLVENLVEMFSRNMSVVWCAVAYTWVGQDFLDHNPLEHWC